MVENTEIPPCPHQEQYEHFVHPQVDTEHGFPVDAGIAGPLALVWQAGCHTICSCQGEQNIKHGLFGRAHDHPAYIAFERSDDAARAYMILAEHYDDICLERSPREHELSDEHTIWLPVLGDPS